MKQDQSFHDYVIHDLFAGFPGIHSRAMFGGWGIYKDGIIFAIIADGALYFKVDETNRTDFEQRGSQPFVYSQGNHKSTTMSYWLVPESVMDDKEDLRQWIERSVGISWNAKRPKEAKSLRKRMAKK